MIGNILGNILAAIIYAALVALAVRLVAYYFNERPLMKIWGFKGKWYERKWNYEAIVAVTKLVQETSRYKRPTTGMGEVRSYAFVQESLVQAYRSTVSSVNILT